MKFLPLILSALLFYSVVLATSAYDWGSRDGIVSGFRQGLLVAQFNYPTRCVRFER